MSDVYRVAIALQMSSNASSVLGALASSLMGAHHHVTKLNKGLAETTGAMTRMKLALGGGLALAGGAAILATLKNVTDHTRELSKELATLKTQGLTPLQIKGADQAARAVTTMVPGSTESGNLKILSEAYSLMGLENAKKALPDLSRAVQVFGAIDGMYDRATESMYSLIRSGEMLGKLQDEHTGLVDPGKLKKFLDVMARVSAATGNKVNAQTLFGMVQQGAPALANMNDDGLMAMLMAAQQMGGPRAGTALTSMYQQFVGGTMTEARAKELHRLGLIGGYDVGRGGHLTFHKGALDTPFARSLEKNPLDAMGLLQKSLASHGFTSIEAQTKELFMILGRQTTQRLVSDFLRNLPNMGSEQGRIKQGQGLDAQAQTRNTEDYSVVEHNMHEAWKNLMEAIGGPQSKAAITVMTQITGGLNYMTEAVRATNPETLVNIGKGLGVLGGALTAAGAGSLLLALGPAGWLVGAVVGATAAFIAFREPFEHWLKSTTGMGPALDAADRGFNKLAISFGKWVGPQLDAADAAMDKFAKASWEWVKSVTPSADALKTAATAVMAEITSWPARLGTAIAEMGAGLVTALGDMFKGLISKLNPFTKTSFEGGEGLGGLIQKASFGGSANDNFGGGSLGASGVARALGRGGGSSGGTALGSVGTGSDYLAVVGGKSYRSAYRAGGRERVGSWLDMFQRPVGEGGLGMPLDKARAMVAMMQGESGINLNPGAIGDHGTAFGTGQWRLGRARNLMAMARSMGLDWRDPRAQQAHMRAEMLGLYGKGGSYRRVYDAIMGAQSGDHALAIGIDRFENPAKKALAYRFRHPYLQGLRRSGAGEHPVATEKPVPTAGPPPQRQQTVHVHNLIVDGKKMAAVVTTHQAEKMRFPLKAGGMDTYGEWRAPGTPVTDAA